FPCRPIMWWWMLAGVLSALLFVPEMQYVLAVRGFSKAHREYLFHVDSFSNAVLRPIAVLLHNATLVVALNILTAGIIIGRRRLEKLAASPTAPGAHTASPALPDGDAPGRSRLRRWAWLWLAAPQLVALVLAIGTHQ